MGNPRSREKAAHPYPSWPPGFLIEPVAEYSRQGLVPATGRGSPRRRDELAIDHGPGTIDINRRPIPADAMEEGVRGCVRLEEGSAAGAAREMSARRRRELCGGTGYHE